MTEKAYIHEWHFDMLVDEKRNIFYRDIIQEHCAGKKVFEIGTGAGLLAALAVKYGAEEVICCEENPYLADVAQKLFDRLGIANRVRLIHKNSTEILTEEIPPVDVILHELFGSDPFEEFMISSLKDARRFLKPRGLILPEKIQLLCRPAYPAPARVIPRFDGIELIEMSKLLAEVHPALRADTLKAPVIPSQEILIQDLLEKDFALILKDPALKDADAMEVTFNILQGKKTYQAAEFDHPGGRVHWFTLSFPKFDEKADNVVFTCKDEKQLQMF